MYGKIFESIYDGSLYGHWEAIVTMQQLIVLADADGVVDMTPSAISGRTSIPLEILERGLKLLSELDPHMKSLADILVGVSVREIMEEMNAEKMPRPYELAGSEGAEENQNDCSTSNPN